MYTYHMSELEILSKITIHIFDSKCVSGRVCHNLGNSNKTSVYFGNDKFKALYTTVKGLMDVLDCIRYSN